MASQPVNTETQARTGESYNGFDMNDDYRQYRDLLEKKMIKWERSRKNGLVAVRLLIFNSLRRLIGQISLRRTVISKR